MKSNLSCVEALSHLAATRYFQKMVAWKTNFQRSLSVEKRAESVVFITTKLRMAGSDCFGWFVCCTHKAWLITHLREHLLKAANSTCLQSKRHFKSHCLYPVKLLNLVEHFNYWILQVNYSLKILLWVALGFPAYEKFDWG